VTNKMQIIVDTRRCQAYGVCVTLHPEVFEVPLGGSSAVVLRDTLDADDLADVEEAVRACPAQAIALRRTDEA
jgi:ferredoxin